MLKKKENLNSLKRNKNKVLLIVINICLFALVVALQFLFENIFLTIGLLLLIGITDYFLCNFPRQKEEKNKEYLSKAFVEAFSYFSIYIETGLPVYKALQATIPFAKKELQERIVTLLREIDEDKSIQPYIHFSNAFSSLAIRQVMLSIYKINEEGGSENYLQQFRALFASFAFESRKEKLLALENKMNSTAMFPLIASSLVMALIALGIVAVLGGMMNGL